MYQRKKLVFIYYLHILNTFVLTTVVGNILVKKCSVNISKDENTDSIKYNITEINCETCTNTDCIYLIASSTHPTNYSYALEFEAINSESISLRKGAVKNSDLSVLVAKSIKLYNIDPGCFEYVPLLKYIDFRYNQILKIVRGVFNYLNELEVIDLRSNNIDEIEKDAFSHLPKLKLVRLEHNKLSLFDDDWFRLSPNANKFIFLSNNQINSMPFKSCMESGNFFTRLFKRKEDSFCALTKHVDLSFNNIITFNRNWFERINNITTLVLSDNKIEIVLHMPGKYFQKLLYFYLNGNALKYIENEAFGEMPNLRLLDLSHNLLTIFNNQWFGFSSFHYPLDMDTINMSYNKIEKLQPSTFDFRVKKIDLSWNAISSVDPDSFSQRTQLLVLNLSHNKLTSITRNWLDVKTLKQLYLSNNSVEKIYSHAFYSLPNLTTLDISFNQIKEIEDYMGPNKNLEVVDLMRNSISLLHSDTFGAENLKELRLQMNHLSFLPNDFFVKNNINKIYLHPNPWQCSCLQEIEYSAYTRNVTIRDSYDREGEENYVLWIGYYPHQFPVCTTAKKTIGCHRKENNYTIEAREKYFEKVHYEKILVIQL